MFQLQAVVVPVPRTGSCANYARTVNSSLPVLQHATVWLRVPLLCVQSNSQEPCGGDDPWQRFNRFRQMCEHNANIGVVLDVMGTSPPVESEWRRWLGEPLKAVILHTDTFLTNKRGFPVLPKAHQEFVKTLLAHNVQLALTGPLLHARAAEEAARDSGAAAAGGSEMESPHSDGASEGAPVNHDSGSSVRQRHALTVYWEYLAHMYSKLPAMSDHQRLEASYRDYLQSPLQPLADNLESQVYETFEKDETKYVQYEHAIAAALRDKRPGGGGNQRTVVMVVGAGRGPLVRAALRACDTCGLVAQRDYIIYAVEKNPNAMVHLQAQWQSLPQWQAAVHLVSHDMRTWNAPSAADIMVSELLGSFGDNELSPECLDGAQRFLAPNGISIPVSYTSFLAPVTAAKLWCDIQNSGGASGSHKDIAHLETPYVVNLHRCALLASTQPCFTFRHPTPQPADNTRGGGCFHFERAADAPAALCHGFAGYFDSVLYGDVTLGIHPPNATPNMFSWFPIFFPLRTPMHVPAGTAVTLHMWRKGSSTKVWYEWAVEEPTPSAVHNVNGRSYHVGL